MKNKIPPDRRSNSGKALPESYCPDCGYQMDSATCITGPDKSRPIEGDLSLCLNCGAILQYGPGMKIMKIEPDAVDDEKTRYHLFFVQNKIRAFRAEHYPKGLRNEPRRAGGGQR